MTSSGGGLAAAAQALAARAHAGQVDKQRRDYLAAHLAPVAALLRPYGDEAEAAGWLHDVLEDCGLSADDLADAGMPPVVVAAVESVSRRPGEDYASLVERAAAHPLGRLVKLADNWVNLTGLDDLAATDPGTAQRLREKYTTARERLVRSLAG